MKSPITVILVAYLTVYLIAWVAWIDLAAIVKVFWAIHLINLSLLLKWTWQNRKSINSVDVLIFSGLFLIFFLPGAYLEYPSDAWEHFRRIFRWSDLGFISDYPNNSKLKIAYFWGYSFLGLVDLENRRLALDLYSTFWQLAVCCQIYRFSKTLGCSKQLSYLQVLGFVFLFGSNIFSYRYYALSSTPLAYILYLECLILLISAFQRKQLHILWPIPILLLGISLNHLQELLFVALLSIVISLYFIDQLLIGRSKKIFRCCIFGAIFAGLLFGYFLHNFFPDFYSRMPKSLIGTTGHIRLWAPQHKQYLETVGVFGVIGIVLSLLFFKKNRLLFLVCLTPIFSLLYPPTALLYAQLIPSSYLTYRILYAIPLSFALGAGIDYLLRALSAHIPILTHRYSQTLLTAVIVLVFSSFSQFPVRGKLFFQLYSPPPAAQLVHLDQTAHWFSDNRDLAKLRHCWIITDNITRTILATHLGMSERFYGGEAIRRIKQKSFDNFKTTEQILRFSQQRKANFCGVLVADKQKIPSIEKSLIAESSNHWRANIADQRMLLDENIVSSAKALLKNNWSATAVPPYFTLYEPQLEENK